MSKLKPYLFWIVCGVIILIELVLLLFISPSGKDGQSTPTAVKGVLDDKSRDLEKLYQKAKNGSPSGREFDAENPKDIEDLAGKDPLWLSTPAWKPVLEPHLSNYSSQLGKIHDYLLSRSQSLHKPIASDKSTKFDWYIQYEAATAELLQKLYDNQCLLLAKGTPGAAGPMTQAPANPGPLGAGGPGFAPGGPGPGGAPPFAPPVAAPAGDVGDAGASDSTPDFKKSSGVRAIAGFLTTTQYPDSERFAELSIQFRVMEQVADALISAKATNLPSPIAPLKTPFESHAQLVSTSWKDATDEAITLNLTLQGPLSAVLAAEAALEENKEDQAPIKVVTGAALDRKVFAPGDRRDITSEPVILRLTFAVLDFTKAPVPQTETTRTPPPPPAPKAPKPPHGPTTPEAGGE